VREENVNRADGFFLCFIFLLYSQSEDILHFKRNNVRERCVGILMAYTCSPFFSGFINIVYLGEPLRIEGIDKIVRNHLLTI
jgi:hypothetical protein